MPIAPTNNSLSNSDFAKLSAFIYEHAGIKMPDVKKTMVEARLRKRLKQLSISSYDEYCKFLFSKRGVEEEIVHMVDVLTTNKTDFFREPRQFDFLNETALPELCRMQGSGINKSIKIWSAGCSSGEEPYTLAIVMSEYALRNPGIKFNILATDISTRVLEKAVTGVYDEERVEPVDEKQLKKYFLRSKDKSKKLVRVSPVLRKAVKFQRLNFMESDFDINTMFDVIFCRNVIIYFDKQTQEKVIGKLIKHLIPGGFFFLGHSESIFNTSLPLVQLAPSTYRKIK